MMFPVAKRPFDTGRGQGGISAAAVSVSGTSLEDYLFLAGRQ